METWSSDCGALAELKEPYIGEVTEYGVAHDIHKKKPAFAWFNPNLLEFETQSLQLSAKATTNELSKCEHQYWNDVHKTIADLSWCCDHPVTCL